jgi:gluconate 2-dehydrogenase gamma chain
MTKRKAKPEGPVSRRGFLKLSGAALLAGVAGGQDAPPTSSEPLHAPHHPPASPYPVSPSTPVVQQFPGEPHSEVPYAPPSPPSPETLRFFTVAEARAVEALTARILPGDPDDPGAREAGVVTYIDFLLSQAHGFAEPVYREPPFAETYAGDEPPENGDPRVIWVPEDELERYGFQSPLTPREAYRAGLAALERFAQAEHGASFADLEEAQQDAILEALEDDEAEGFTAPSAAEFFGMVHCHTVEGMFADPAYGGNRELVGWRLLDYPGAQRAYTAQDMLTNGHNRIPRSLHDLAHVHPGEPANRFVRLPVVGSDGGTREDTR